MIAATVSTAAMRWDQDARTGWRRTSQANRVAAARGCRGTVESNSASTVAAARCSSPRCRRSVVFGCITRHLDCSLLWRKAEADQPRQQFPDDAGDRIVSRYRGWTRKVQEGSGVRVNFSRSTRSIDVTKVHSDPTFAQKLSPSGYVHRKGGRNYFDRLDPVLCKVASSTDRQGIVRV